MTEEITTWRGITIYKCDGSVLLERNVLCKYREWEGGSSLRWDEPIYIHSGQTCSIGPPFAEEVESDSRNRQRVRGGQGHVRDVPDRPSPLSEHERLEDRS